MIAPSEGRCCDAGGTGSGCHGGTYRQVRGNDRAVYELAADAARLCGAGAPLVDSTMIYETYQQRDQVAV